MMSARQALRSIGWFVSELIPPRIPAHVAAYQAQMNWLTDHAKADWLADLEAEIDTWEPQTTPSPVRAGEGGPAGTCRPAGHQTTLSPPAHPEGDGGPAGSDCPPSPAGQPNFNAPLDVVDLSGGDDGWWMPQDGAPAPFRGGIANRWGVVIGRFDTLAQAEHVAATINSQLGDNALLDGDLDWAAGVIRAYAATTPMLPVVERAQLRALSERLATK